MIKTIKELSCAYKINLEWIDLQLWRRVIKEANTAWLVEFTL